MKTQNTFRIQPTDPVVMSSLHTLRVMYEDNHVVVVNKRSSDIIQHDENGDKTLCSVVRDYVKVRYNKPGLAFIGTVHRLDRPVSGVIIYARTTKALNRLMNAFKYREIQKTYWAVVKNPPPKQEDTVINYLIKNAKLNKSFAYDKPSEGRKESELRYRVVGRSDHYTFLEINPKSGRHHQIRATLSSLGCPIKGDVKYGALRTNDNASIHLHARQVQFMHPVKKTPMTVIAPPPEDPLWTEFLRQAEGY